MSKWRAARGAANIGCIVWLAVVGTLVYLGLKIIPVKIRTSQFYDTMQEQAGFGSIKPIHAIEFEILQKAEELHLPVTKQNLSIKRSSREITIESDYEITIEFLFGYKYVWKHHPKVVRPLFAV